MAKSERHHQSESDTAGILTPPPLLYALGLAVGLAAEAALPSPDVPRRFRQASGACLLASGMGLAGWFFYSFRRAETPVDASKPTANLVTSGPYRITRNPGYLSLTLSYAGLTMLANAIWPFVSLVPVIAVVDLGVIRREERYLERRFGTAYLEYRAGTRRWI